MTRSTATFVSILSIIVLILSVNMIGGQLFKASRIDLTERNLYTLSAGTRKILQSLEEPISLKFYFSEGLATDFSQIHSYGLRIKDLLVEMAAVSGGKLELQIIDPEPYSVEEDEAASFGLTGAALESGERLFLGLVGTNLVDGVETVPFFAPEREQYLEYDIASLIHTLQSPDKPVLGILSSLPLATGAGGMAAMLGGGAGPYVVYEQLAETFDLETLEPDLNQVPETISVLMIAHPPGLSPTALYAIDQFVMRGGRLLVFLDPMAEAAQGPGGQPMPGMAPSSTLDPLLESWGVSFDTTQIALDRENALPVNAGGGQILPYVAWLKLQGAGISSDDLVTADIDTIQLATAGFLTPLDGATTEFTPLLKTGVDSQAMSAMIMRFGGAPQALLNEFAPDENIYTIAARLTGPVNTAFPDGAPEPAADENAGDTENAAPPEPQDPLPAHLSASEKPLSLILVGDADILEDRFWVQTQSFLGSRIAQPTAGNGFFVLNAAQNLMGSDDLISLRSRQQSERPFEKVIELERAARTDYAQEEERLQQQIAETESRLQALQARRPENEAAFDPETGTAILTDEERAEVRRFEAELAASRRALREVQRELRADVIALGSWIKMINIALVPILIGIAAIGLAIVRTQRRRAGAQQAGATQ